MTPIEVFMGLGGIVLTILNTWIIVAVKNFRDDVNALRIQDSDMREKIGSIQLLVAGNYVTKDEFEKGMETQTRTLSDKIDNFVKLMHKRTTD